MATKRIKMILNMGTEKSVADIGYTPKSFCSYESYGSYGNNMGPVGPLVQNNGLNEMEWTEYHQKWIP